MILFVTIALTTAPTAQTYQPATKHLNRLFKLVLFYFVIIRMCGSSSSRSRNNGVYYADHEHDHDDDGDGDGDYDCVYF